MEVRRGSPSRGALKRFVQQIVREFGHGDLPVPGFVVEDGHEKPADGWGIVPWTCHDEDGLRLMSLGGRILLAHLVIPQTPLLLRGGDQNSTPYLFVSNAFNGS